MSIPNTVRMKRRPTHPGEMLREDFLPDYDLTASGLAKALGVSHQSINELLRERRRVSPEMALRLARLFGNSAVYIVVTDDTLQVDLEDGRTISVPIGWFPRLAHGSPAEKANFELSGAGRGIHWPDLDEDI